jgi:hypothetical protein
VVTCSLDGWLRFVSRSCLDYDGSRPPLFDVKLAVHSSSGGGGKGGGHVVTIEPSASEIIGVLGHQLDELVSGVRSMQTIDATLMALLHLQVGGGGHIAQHEDLERSGYIIHRVHNTHSWVASLRIGA